MVSKIITLINKLVKVMIAKQAVINLVGFIEKNCIKYSFSWLLTLCLKIMFISAFMTQVSSSLNAQETTETEQEATVENLTDYQHDGFYLRFHLGFGYLQSVISDVAGSDIKTSGLSGAFRIQIGGVLYNNFILFGNIGAFVAQEPTVEYNSSSGMPLNNIVFNEIGAGISYYFMPENIYISGTVGIGKHVENNKGGLQGSTKSQLSIHISLGKEWWTHKDWGLGIAAYYYINPTEGETIVGFRRALNQSFGLYFSATYN